MDEGSGFVPTHVQADGNWLSSGLKWNVMLNMRDSVMWNWPLLSIVSHYPRCPVARMAKATFFTLLFTQYKVQELLMVKGYQMRLFYGCKNPRLWGYLG